MDTSIPNKLKHSSVSFNDRLPSGGALRNSAPAVHATPQNKDKSIKHRYPSHAITPKKSKTRQYFPTMEINIEPEQLLKMLSETETKPNPENKMTPLISQKESRISTPVSSISRSDSNSYSPSVTPVFTSSNFYATPNAKNTKKLNKKTVKITAMKDVDDVLIRNIADTVKEVVECWYDLSTEWQRLRIASVKNLEIFISEKSEAMKSACKSIGIEAVGEAVSVGENLKDMSALTYDLASRIEKLQDFGVLDELYGSIVPFTTMSLMDIVSRLRKAHHLYRKEYYLKKEACSDLISLISVDVQGEECTESLNKVLTVWSRDVHVKKKDLMLFTMMQEVGMA